MSPRSSADRTLAGSRPGYLAETNRDEAVDAEEGAAQMPRVARRPGCKRPALAGEVTLAGSHGG
jgi:hypothetical protein